MSPEYAINGVVSVKTDVYSFGVLLLEVISGMKNNSCINSNEPFNLMGHVSFTSNQFIKFNFSLTKCVWVSVCQT